MSTIMVLPFPGGPYSNRLLEVQPPCAESSQLWSCEEIRVSFLSRSSGRTGQLRNEFSLRFGAGTGSAIGPPSCASCTTTLNRCSRCRTTFFIVPVAPTADLLQAACCERRGPPEPVVSFSQIPDSSATRASRQRGGAHV